MAADKELLTEVALELWNTTKKLRPGLPKAPRAQLVLKALLTIGDMSDQLEAAMVLGVIESQEPDDEPGQGEAAGEDKTNPMPRPSGRPPELCASAPAAADQDLQMRRTRSPFPLQMLLDGLSSKKDAAQSE